MAPDEANNTPLRRVEFKEHINQDSKICKGSGKVIKKTRDVEPYICSVCNQSVGVYMIVLE